MAAIPVYTYRLGTELRPITFDVYQDYPNDDELEDLSSGWTYEFKVGTSATAAASFTKTTGVTLSATSPSVAVNWATTGELNGLTADTRYLMQGRLRRSSDSRDLDLPDVHIYIRPYMT